MAAGEYELALDAYMRAAARKASPRHAGGHGHRPTCASAGSARPRTCFAAAVEEDPTFVPAWNNLGVLLMEQGKYGEASEIFRRAYAADSGNSDTIRDNLRLALARMEDPFYTGCQRGRRRHGPVQRRGRRGQLIGVGDEDALSPEEALESIEPL